MTTDTRALLAQGALGAAIEAQTAIVRQRAGDSDARALLADLLCFAGEFERADKQLDVISSQRTELAVPVALSRQLIRAALVRRDVFENGRAPETLAGADGTIQAALRVLLELRQGRPGEAAAAAAALEAAHGPLKGSCDGAEFDDIRDADDASARILEVLTSTGKYYWVPLNAVVTLEFRKPTRIRDLLWRQAHLDVRGGPDGEVGGVLHPRQAVAVADDPAIVAGAQTDAVAPVQDPEHGLQGVVAVRPAPGDAQEQVQFGRGRPVAPVRAHRAGSQPSTTTRTRASPRTACRRRGISGQGSEAGSHSW